MLHGTLRESAEVIGTHPDMTVPNVPTSRTPPFTRPPGQAHLLDSSLAPCLARVPAVLSLTLRGQQDSESHHAAMHQPRAPGAPGGSGACEKWPVVIFVAPVLQRSVVWGRDADCSQPESTGPLVCSHSGAPTIG